MLETSVACIVASEGLATWLSKALAIVVENPVLPSLARMKDLFCFLSSDLSPTTDISCITISRWTPRGRGHADRREPHEAYADRPYDRMAIAVSPA